MKIGIKIIVTAVLVYWQSLNICPGCCGMNVIDVDIEDCTIIGLDGAKTYIKTMQKVIECISEENYGKDFVAFNSNSTGVIIVVFNSSIRSKIKDKKAKLVKKFKDTDLYFLILDVEDENEMNNYSIEAVKDKKNTFKLVVQGTGVKPTIGVRLTDTIYNK